MQSPIDRLKERVLGKKGKYSETKLTGLLYVVREFGCLGEIIGRNFEIIDSKGKLIYTIRQKPMAICQLNVLLKEFEVIKRLDNEIEAKKWGAGRKGTQKLRRK